MNSQNGGNGNRGTDTSKRRFLKSVSAAFVTIQVGRAMTLLMKKNATQLREIAKITFEHHALALQNGFLAGSASGIEMAQKDIAKFLDEQGLNEKDYQIVLDIMLTLIFGKTILPLFLKEEIAKSFKATLWSMSIWYPLSNADTKHHWNEEMLSALKSVGIMMGIVTGVQSLSVDFDSFIETEARIDYLPQVKKMVGEQPLQGILGAYNISILDSTDTGGENIVVGENDIQIPCHIFLEILPIIKNNDRVLFVEEVLSYIINPAEKEKARGIMNYVSGNDAQNRQLETKNRDKINEITAGIIYEETQTIVAVVLGTQWVMGVGQATLLKERIYHLGTMLRNLGLSRGMDEASARDLEGKFIAVNIAYLFNRMSIYSDLGPITGAVKEGGETGERFGWLKGIWSFINGQGPVALTNLAPYFTAVDDIISSTGIRGSKPWNRKNILRKMGSALKHMKQVFGSFSYTAGAFTRDKKSPEFLRNTRLREQVEGYNSASRVTQLLSFASLSDQEKKNCITSLGQLLSDTAKDSHVFSCTHTITMTCSETQRERKIHFSSVFEVLEFIQDVIGELCCDMAIASLFNANKKSLTKFYDLLHHTTARTTEKIQEISTFLREQLDISEHIGAESMKETFRLVLDYHTSKNQDTETTTNTTIHHQLEGLFDLDFTTQNLGEHIKWGGVQGIAQMLQTNLMFLKYAEETLGGEDSFVRSMKQNFLANLQNNEFKLYFQKAKLRFSASLSSDEKNYYSAFISDIEGSDFLLSDMKEEYKQAKAALEDEETKSFLESLNLNVEKGIESLFKQGEDKLGLSNFEMLQMIVMIQSPFVTSVAHSMETLMSGSKEFVSEGHQKWLAGLTTYILSMFADNYVGLIVGVKILKSMGVNTFEAIKYISKFSVIGGSMVKTGNAPNALVSKDGVQKFYGSYHTSNPHEKETTHVFLDTLASLLGVPIEVLYDVTTLHFTPAFDELHTTKGVVSGVVAGVAQYARRGFMKAILGRE